MLSPLTSPNRNHSLPSTRRRRSRLHDFARSRSISTTEWGDSFVAWGRRKLARDRCPCAAEPSAHAPATLDAPGPFLGASRRQTLHSPSFRIQASYDDRARRNSRSAQSSLRRKMAALIKEPTFSFFNRARPQGGSLSELAKAPGTGLTTTRGKIWPTN